MDGYFLRIKENSDLNHESETTNLVTGLQIFVSTKLSCLCVSVCLHLENFRLPFLLASSISFFKFSKLTKVFRPLPL
jgi:hypothetical protein